MKLLTLSLFVTLCAIAAVRNAPGGSASTQPSYMPDGQLKLPADYREWVFVTSGYGMNYSAGTVSHPAFTNVFVTPQAYQSFKSNGKWPDKSMFVVEIYSPASNGSINRSGFYQQTLLGLDVEVKDSSRPNQWSYYNFNPGASSAAELTGGGCNKCHNDNGAVEHTFVQFYPTLLDVATKKGTLKKHPGNLP